MATTQAEYLGIAKKTLPQKTTYRSQTNLKISESKPQKNKQAVTTIKRNIPITENRKEGTIASRRKS
jgi:hypothetical protein